jgi:hypothetical protein
MQNEDWRMQIHGLQIEDWGGAGAIHNRQSVDRQSPIFNP